MTDLLHHFIYLFDEHDIPHVYIPSILHDFGFQMSHLISDKNLVSKVDDDVITYLSKQFSVRVEWLRGRSDEPISGYGVEGGWYLSGRRLCTHLADLVREDKHPEVIFVRKASLDADIGIIVKKAQFISEKVPYSTYEWWGYDRWDYVGTRIILKCLIRFCWRLYHAFYGESKVRMYSVRLKDAAFEGLQRGEILPVTALKERAHPHGFWYAEDYVLDPGTSAVPLREPEEYGMVLEHYELLHLGEIESDVRGMTGSM